MQNIDKEIWTVFNVVSLVMLSLSKFSMGIMDSMLGPCVPDLAHKFNMTEEDYTTSIAARGYTLIIGVQIAALVLNHAYHYIELAVSVCMFGFAIGAFMIPWFGSTGMLILTYGIWGFFHGTFSMFGVVHIVRLIGPQSPPFVSAVDLMYVVGEAFAPLLAEPFLTKLNSVQNTYCITNDSLAPNISCTSQNIIWSDKVHIPFTIFGAICCTIASGFIILYFVKPAPDWTSQSHTVSKESSLPHFAKYILVFLFFWIMVLFVTHERGLAYHLYMIATESKLKFSKSEAVYFVSVYEMSSLFTRVGFSIALNYVSVPKVYHLTTVLALLSGVCLASFGLDSHVSLWIFAPLTNAFLDPVYFLVYTYADRYMYVSGWISSAIESGCAVGFILVGWLTSLIHKLYRAEGLLVAFSVILTLLNILSILVYTIGNHYGERYKVQPLLNQTIGKEPKSQSDEE